MSICSCNSKFPRACEDEGPEQQAPAADPAAIQAQADRSAELWDKDAAWQRTTDMVHSLAESSNEDRKAEDARQKAMSANMDSNWKRRRMEQLPEEEYLAWETQWEATQADRKRRKADNKNKQQIPELLEMVMISLYQRKLGSTTHGIARPRRRRGQSVTPYKCQALT